MRWGGGVHETNLNPELIELGKGKGASVQPLTAGVLPTDEVLVRLQQPPDFRVVVDRVLQGLHGEFGRFVKRMVVVVMVGGGGGRGRGGGCGCGRREYGRRGWRGATATAPAGAAGCAARATARRSPSRRLALLICNRGSTRA